MCQNSLLLYRFKAITSVPLDEGKHIPNDRGSYGGFKVCPQGPLTKREPNSPLECGPDLVTPKKQCGGSDAV